MKTARPAIACFAALAIAALGAWAAFAALTGEGQTRYVRVDNDLVCASSDADMPFEYRLAAFDANGARSDVSFKTVRELRDDALLELKVLPLRGVISWEEVAPDEVPDAAGAALEAD